MATAVSLTGSDLADQVPDGERSCETGDRTLADEIRGGVQCLVHGLAALLQHLLCIFRVETAEDSGGCAMSIRALLFGCHMGVPPIRQPRHRPCPRLGAARTPSARAPPRAAGGRSPRASGDR